MLNEINNTNLYKTRDKWWLFSASYNAANKVGIEVGQ